MLLLLLMMMVVAVMKRRVFQVFGLCRDLWRYSGR